MAVAALLEGGAGERRQVAIAGAINEGLADDGVTPRLGLDEGGADHAGFGHQHTDERRVEQDLGTAGQHDSQTIARPLVGLRAPTVNGILEITHNRKGSCCRSDGQPVDDGKGLTGEASERTCFTIGGIPAPVFGKHGRSPIKHSPTRPGKQNEP